MPPRARPWIPLAAALLACALPVASAQGQAALGVSPVRLAIADAQAGEAYVHPFLLTNHLGRNITVEVQADGEAGPWATTEPGSGFTMASGQRRTVHVAVIVPDGTGPGVRNGTLRFVSDPQPGGNVEVRSAVAVLLSVQVGGEARVNLTWRGFHVPDVETGSQVLGYAWLRNDGNVASRGQVNATLLDAEGNAVAGASANATPRPGEEVELAVRVPAVPELGTHILRFQTHDGRTEDIAFDVKPGAVRTQSLFTLTHPAQAQQGDPVRFLAAFRAPSEAEARLEVEVLQGGGRVTLVQGPDVPVLPGRMGNLTATWTAGEPGRYDLVARVLHNGSWTQEESSIQVVPRPAATTSEGTPGPGLAAVALAAVAAVAYRRRGMRFHRP